MFIFGKSASLYLHFPCFDGTISAVLAALFLKQTRGWNCKDIHPVNYHLQKEWLDTLLPKRSAVVDFLYHPQAAFWADHHETSFLTGQLRTDYESRKSADRIYDRQSGSCALLLWRNMQEVFQGDQRLQEMVLWADKIDSARYESVQEAFSNSHPALVLYRSLAVEADAAYCSYLLRRLQRASLAEAVQAAQVQKRFTQAVELSEAGLKKMRAALRLDGNIAVYELTSDGSLINRYAPYYFYPEALYSVAITHSEHGARIMTMRNPWREFECLNLGEFMKKFGGGGHQRVGSLILGKDREGEVSGIVAELLNSLAASVAGRC
jgi:hypothetical protein